MFKKLVIHNVPSTEFGTKFLYKLLPKSRSMNKDSKSKIRVYNCHETKPKIMQRKKKNHIKIETSVEISNDKTKSQNYVPNESLQSENLAPENWELVYNNILEMRKDLTAPVDSMGCERAHDKKAEPKVQRFQCLVSLMLSSQTKDEVNYAAMTRLKENGLTVDKLLETDDETLGKLIYPVGFWKNKVKYLKKTSLILKEKYDCDIPDTVKDLCSLPGVGPKMAYICMNIAWKKPTGIGVDTHVHRISNRLKWVHGPKSGPTKNPEDTRKYLESWLPKSKWIEINWLLVGFGQELCRPVNPKCSDCLNRNLCPVGRKAKIS